MTNRTSTREYASRAVSDSRCPSSPAQGSAGPCNESSRPVRLFRWLGNKVFRNPITLAVASLVWLIWRSGTNPRRLSYPCQQAAAANLGFLAVLFIPAIARPRAGRRTARQQWVRVVAGSVAAAGLLSVLISAGVSVYSDVTGDYTPGHPATESWSPVDLSVPTPMSPRLLETSGSESIVAVNRNPAATYGSAAPYGPGPDTAYELIWKSVADLHLGTEDNPLADFLEDTDGDGVIEAHIKPNHVQTASDINGERSPGYTHPATFRPLVDMLAMAGADRITIGDACAIENYRYLSEIAPTNGLTQSYVAQMEAAARTLPGAKPDLNVTMIDLNAVGQFTWIDLGADPGETGASSWYGSGYDEPDMVKSTGGDATYFSTPDSHGRPGPTKANCKGWLAIPNGLLNADAVIDLAKLKVHYYGVTTAALKNYVGATALSTYNTSSWPGWSRVCHEPTAPSDYEKTFGNDMLWRDLADAHRSMLYWRFDQQQGGIIHDTVQRRLLCVLDAIMAAEKEHFPGTPTPYWLHTIVAGVDPVAVDAVGARLQRYDFRHIPIINNIHATSIGSNWPIGTADPGQVRLVGDTLIGENYSHVFDADERHGPWWPDWTDMIINDLAPPTIHTGTAENTAPGTWFIQAQVSAAHVVYYYYGDDGTGASNVVRLGRNGDTYTATINDPTAGNGHLVAQDSYFNAATSSVTSMPWIKVEPEALEPVVNIGAPSGEDTLTISNVGIGTMDINPSADMPWVSFDVTQANVLSTAPLDIIVSYDTSLMVAAGTYEAMIRIDSTTAGNGPVFVPVTLTLATVKPDFNGDGDVDQEDFGHLQACQGGNGQSAETGCENADLDGDLDVDTMDVEKFRACMSGATNIADPACDDQ